MLEKIIKGINDRFKENVAELNMKDGNELFVQRIGNEYTLYNGCELVIGDVSLKYIAWIIMRRAYKF